MRLIATLVAVLWASSLSATPPPGHPSVDQAAKVLRLPQSGDPHAVGVVREAHDSNSYTYLAVELPGGEIAWLAAPRTEVPVGSRIAFGDGAYLTNFYSKKLKRTFAGILFVPGIKVVPE
ncbi:hypothetical protein [Motiliproteus sediminis]|uniref:hypothetical protein n=1 Tax=Motiliproteus sediminis TaxID=1468178 RepID=UPI001AEF8AFE|nr:hypothetical protein [Motiliproteus sediminis]